MASDWLPDDEQLFVALRRALRERDQVPAQFIEVGKASYTWYSVDAELATLTYDSLHDLHSPLPVRMDTASLRAIRFGTGELEIQLQISASALMGQLVPAEAGEVDLVQVGMEPRTVLIDDDGWFVIRPLPSGLVRLGCRTRSGRTVLTLPFTL